jgi:hypothetical protein
MCALREGMRSALDTRRPLIPLERMPIDSWKDTDAQSHNTRLRILGSLALINSDQSEKTALEVLATCSELMAGFLSDADFVDVPLARMVSEQYAAERRQEIRRDRATPSERTEPGLGPAPREPVPAEPEHTTHYSVIDARGNAVAVTTTINSLYGSRVTVTGAGFLLNNEMDDFTARPGVPNQFGLVQGAANAIEPGKRMLSAMTPTIVLDADGQPRLILGSPGGPTIMRLCPPAAATSIARLALSWPLMSAMSGNSPAACLIAGVGRDKTWVPRKWLATAIRLRGAMMSISAPGHAASGPHSCGQMRPLPSAFAPIAAGSAPATGAMVPSSESSPSTA